MFFQTFIPNCQYLYTDIFVISMTFGNSETDWTVSKTESTPQIKSGQTPKISDSCCCCLLAQFFLQMMNSSISKFPVGWYFSWLQRFWAGEIKFCTAAAVAWNLHWGNNLRVWFQKQLVPPYLWNLCPYAALKLVGRLNIDRSFAEGEKIEAKLSDEVEKQVAPSLHLSRSLPAQATGHTNTQIHKCTNIKDMFVF